MNVVHQPSEQQLANSKSVMVIGVFTHFWTILVVICWIPSIHISLLLLLTSISKLDYFIIQWY